MREIATGVALLVLSIGLFSITPTPAPSKTPTPAPNATIATASADTPATADFQPFRQSDLRVITGNVQRPNGIVWFNDKLYVVCNGDWTIYEIDDTTGSTRTYIYGVRNGHALHAEQNERNELVLWVPDFDTGSLLQVNAVRAPQPVARGLQSPWGIAYVDESHFLVTSLGANSVLLATRDGEITLILDELRAPTGIAYDAETGIAYVANNGSARRALEWFDLADETPTAHPLVSGIQSVTGIALADDGYLYIAYALGTRGVIGRVDPVACRENGGCDNSAVEIVIYTELAAPLAGLTITPDMRLFVHTMFRPEIYWVQLPQANPG